MRNRVKGAVAAAATVAIVGPLGYFWQASLLPSTYDMAAMGHADFGGGPPVGHGSLSVADLKGPSTGTPDVAVELTAARGQNGRYTLNGASPGPEIRATKGDLVQVTLLNADIADGVTLHWHGVDVPNAEDGVAGVTQDAVAPGRRHVYRFVATDPGTYWYHSHQVSHEQVRQGLFGPLVITDPAAPATGVDQLVTVHTYDGRRTVNGAPGESPLPASPGQVVRARVINTDAGPLRAWVSGTPYQVAAVDGHDLTTASPPTPPPATASSAPSDTTSARPGAASVPPGAVPSAPSGTNSTAPPPGAAFQATSLPDISDKSVIVTAGGRVDLLFTVPASGAARVEVGAGAALVAGGAPASAEPTTFVDLLSYGTPAPLGFDPAKAARVFEYRVGRRAGFLDGVPGLWWSVNGGLYPDVPMYMVNVGDVVRMKISNSSGEVHPMHLHGHHAVVLSRDGVAATGSPWWVDSLDVGDGETYEIAFVADNPGIWADHCHNLEHAADGLLAHLAYANVSTPYRVGGKAANSPE